jgi:cytochrome c551/c552
VEDVRKLRPSYKEIAQQAGEHRAAKVKRVRPRRTGRCDECANIAIRSVLALILDGQTKWLPL